MITAGKAIAYLLLDTNNFQAGLKSANAQLKIFEKDGASTAQKIQGVGGALTTIGGTLTKNLTVPLVGAGATMVKFSSDYESAFAGVRKTVDATEEEYQKLSDSIIDVSKRMPTAATEIAGVMEAAGQLGIAKENLTSFTETMVMLGDTTNLSADSAASALAKFANVTNMSADNYDRLGSVIVDLGNNFATTEADIVDMGTNLAATGNLVGLTQPQIMAVATALSSCGIEAEAGGSAISKLLKQIDVAVQTFETSSKVIDSTGYSLRDLEMLADQDASSFKKVAASLGLTSDELKNYMDHANDLQDFADVAGVSAEQFIQAWGDDAVGALGLFIDGLNDTERNGKSAVEILDEMGITEVRLSNAVLSLASSNGILTDAVDLANSAWDDNTALADEAEQRYATFASQCSILWNEIKALGIELGNELIPTVKDLVGGVSDIVSWFSSLDSGTKRTIVNLGLVAAAVGPVTTVFGKLTSGVGTVISTISTATSAFSAAGGGIAGLGSALMSVITPAGLVVAGMTALVGIGYALYKIYGQSSEKVTEFSQVMDKSAESIEKIDETTEALEKLEQARLDSYASQSAEIETTEHLKDKLSELVDENGNLIGSKDELQSVIQRLKEQGFDVEYDATLNQIENYDELIDTISEYIEQKKAQIMLDSLEAEYQNALTQKAQYYSEYAEYLSECYEIQKLLNDEEYISGLSVKEFEELGNRFNELNEKASEAFKNYKSACEVIDVYDKSMSAIAEGDFETATQLLSGYYEDVAETIKRQSDYAKDEQEKAITELSAQLVEQIQAYGGAMQLGNETILNDAKIYLEEAASELEKAGVKIPESLIKGIEDGSIGIDEAMLLLTATVEASNGEIDTAITYLEQAANEFEKAGAEIPEGLIEGVKSGEISVEDAINQLGDVAELAARQNALKFQDVANEFLVDLLDYSEILKDELDSKNEELTTAMLQKIEETAEHVKEAGVTIPEGLVDGIKSGDVSVEEAVLVLASAIEASGGEVSGAMRETVNNILAELDGMDEDAKEQMRYTVEGMLEELKAANPELYAAAESNADSIINAIDGSLGIASPSRVMREKGVYTIQGFIQGMESQSGTALSSIGSIMNSIKTVAGSISFVSIGENAISGIMSGLNSKKQSLLSTAKSIASSVSSTIKSALKINSPSRVMAEIGEFTTAGMELGLLNGKESLYNTASIIAADTAEALSGITNTRISYQQYPAYDYGDKLDRLIDVVERLADSEPYLEINGRAFGRMVREYV